jgi:hypothetical protein
MRCFAANCANPLRVVHRELAGDRPSTQCLRKRERVLELVVRVIWNAVVLDDFDHHSGVFVHLSDFMRLAHRRRDAPLANVLQLRLRSGLLFRRWWRRRTGRSTSTIATARLRLQIDRQPHKRFDRTRTQFNAADPELDAALQNVFSRRRLIAEVVRYVHPDNDAVDFRIGFVSRPRCPRQKARSGNGRQCELADLTSCVLHDEPFNEGARTALTRQNAWDIQRSASL